VCLTISLPSKIKTVFLSSLSVSRPLLVVRHGLSTVVESTNHIRVIRRHEPFQVSGVAAFLNRQIFSERLAVSPRHKVVSRNLWSTWPNCPHSLANVRSRLPSMADVVLTLNPNGREFFPSFSATLPVVRLVRQSSRLFVTAVQTMFTSSVFCKSF